MKILLAILVLSCTSFAAVCGDANGDGSVNVIDALVTAQVATGQAAPAGFVIWAADVYMPCNGEVTVLDALLIAAWSAGGSVTLACC